MRFFVSSCLFIYSYFFFFLALALTLLYLYNMYFNIYVCFLLSILCVCLYYFFFFLSIFLLLVHREHLNNNGWRRKKKKNFLMKVPTPKKNCAQAMGRFQSLKILSHSALSIFLSWHSSIKTSISQTT